MNTVVLTDDAKVILMLCGRFHRGNGPESAKPLNIREYNRVTEWLSASGERPESLLTDAGRQMLSEGSEGIDHGRIVQLLSRGPSMAFAIEQWSSAGVWVICRSDADYPQRFMQHLKTKAPPILFGIGDRQLLDRGGLAIVGSRNVAASGEEFTRQAVHECAAQSIQVVSGGARGVDQVAMLGVLESGGTAIGVLADSLLKSAVAKKYRDHIREKRLVLVTPYSPDAGFDVGNAMGRNKLIYSLADFALIISADKGKGGTWAGATEELRREDPRPVLVRQGPDVPDGNRELLNLGAQPFPAPPWEENLADRLNNAATVKPQLPPTQQGLPFSESAKPVLAVGVAKEQVVEYRVDRIEPIEHEAKDAPPDDDPTPSIFEAVLPVLLSALKEWKTPKELVENLDIRKPQLDDWLNRALEEGRVERRTRPVRYRRI